MKQTKTLAKIIACTLAFALAFTSPVQSQKTEKSKLSLNPGQKFQTENKARTVTSMEMMGQQMDVTADVSATLNFDIKTKKENTYTVDLTMTKMSLVADMMGQSMNYDSEKKEDSASEIGKSLKDKLNVPQEMEMNEDGKVTVTKKAADKKDESGMGAMMKNFGAGADESAIADNMFLLMPKNLKVGDAWSDSLIADGMKTYRDYTVKSLQGNDATLTLSGKQTINKVMDNQGMEMTLAMEAKLSGEMIVDVASSVIKQKTLLSDGTGSMDMMGQSVPMTTKVETTASTKSL